MIGTRSYVPRRPAAPIVDTGLGLSPVKPFVPSGAPVPGGVPVKENVKTDNPVKHFVPPVPPTAPVAKGGTVTENAKPVAPAPAPAAPVASPAPKTENGSAGVGGAGKNVTTAGTVPAVKTEKTDGQVAKPKTPDTVTTPVKKNEKPKEKVVEPAVPKSSAAEEAAVKKEDATTGNKDTDEKMSKAEKAALRFIQNKKTLQQKKDALERGMKELEAKKKQLRQEKKEAEAKLKKFDKQEEIILGLAAIPTAAEDRPNRIKAIDAFFNVLNLFDASKVSDGKKFSELYNAIHPVTLLFDYVKRCTHYDAEKNKVVVDGDELFLLVKQRLEEQERLKTEAEKTLKAMANK